MQDGPQELLAEKHVAYIVQLGKAENTLAYHLTEHLRLNGIYWAITSLALLGRLDALDRRATVEYVTSCWDEQSGGFGSHPNHDAHMLSTLSAIQILVTHDALEESGVDIGRIVHYILSLRPSRHGFFTGDSWGESDTRFTYCAINALSLLGHLHRLDDMDDGVSIKDRIVDCLRQCMNFDGGFGNNPGAETHSGQVFTAVAALAILDRLDIIDRDNLSWWLSERQVDNGGLNGRPQKLEDVCYSWWVLSALSILHRLHWINKDKLISFILSAQDPDNGGIADRPGDVSDVFHTLFGVAGLSMLGYPGIARVDPVYCMPVSTIERLDLKKSYTLFKKRGTMTAATQSHSQHKLLYLNVDDERTICLLDTPPPPYENSQGNNNSNNNAITPSTSATPRVSEEYAREDAPLLQQYDEYDEDEYELADEDDERTTWQRYWSGTLNSMHWKALAHLTIISFPLALFAWVFCFVGSVITASLLITLPIGLGFGWVVLVGARAMARLELQIQNHFYPTSTTLSSRKRPIFQRIRRVRPFGHVEYETSFYTNSLAMFQDSFSYRCVTYFVLFKPPIALLLLIVSVTVVPLSLILIVPIPVLLRLATAFGYWQAKYARDVLH
ncbi:hypothetical protein E3P99_00683 [Wallemia hederae]|uniref:Geranylgeranyl transferase type-2 subunit beta n=1 Tax=Wallemia hederae TaxID=1540922 RepID=A0A4T0FUK3_9BASI|nr:hypothetical protein E3P99_00683 [Wallemia hederae]